MFFNSGVKRKARVSLPPFSNRFCESRLNSPDLVFFFFHMLLNRANKGLKAAYSSFFCLQWGARFFLGPAPAPPTRLFSYPLFNSFYTPLMGIKL